MFVSRVQSGAALLKGVKSAPPNTGQGPGAVTTEMSGQYRTFFSGFAGPPDASPLRL